jgi:hypothetical protein
MEKAFRDLQIVELVEYEADLSEGARHAGRSALLRSLPALHVGCVKAQTPAAQRSTVQVHGREPTCGATQDARNAGSPG